MVAIKYLIFIIILYISIISGTFVLLFDNIKQNMIEKYEDFNRLNIENFETKVQPYLLHNKYEQLLEEIEVLKLKNILTELKLEYTAYLITIDSILANSNNIKTKDWVLSDVVIDSKFGELEKYSDTIYKFIPDEDYEVATPIEIKFQALNDNNMQNSISTISLILPEVLITQNEENEEDNIKQLLKEFLHLSDIKNEKLFLVDNINNFAKITYTIDNNIILKSIYQKLLEVLIVISTLFISIIVCILLFVYYIQRTMVIKYLKELEVYTSDILDNKFYKFDLKHLKQKNITTIARTIGGISKKMASIINELNVNKDTLELQISTDSLTKLPNSKVFEHDMKALFITDINSYVATVRLEVLKTFSKNNSQLKTDELIVDFVTMLKNVMKEKNDKHSNIYRFYGSEFMIISKLTDYEIMEDILYTISEKAGLLCKRYEIDSKLYHSVAVPFDHYSTTENILSDIEKLYNKTIKENSTFIVQDSEAVNEKDARLEKVIKSIITNDAFTITQKFDTYLFNEPDTLVMQEVAANLLNTDGTNIPIGTFIAVAENLDIATEFDKQMIIKTFKYIKKNNIIHDMAVNISISSLNDPSFITWLESQLLYDYKNIIDKVVFSVTTFAAKNNFETFTKFSHQIKEFKGRILLKRFSYNDLTLEQLEELHLDFIRVHKDYTTNINTERELILRNITNFASIHDIFVLGDIVTTDEDYNALKKLKFYATSR
jgi:EAL domain-containing protein (putative c-di-GMP-specific phosphodiesterase class I)/GGDEF domain-containing protein